MAFCQITDMALLRAYVAEWRAQNGLPPKKGSAMATSTDDIQPWPKVPPPSHRQPEELALKYARQTRTAAVFIAWVVAAGLILSVILGVIGGVMIAKAVSDANTISSPPSSSCDYTNPNWPDC